MEIVGFGQEPNQFRFKKDWNLLPSLAGIKSRLYKFEGKIQNSGDLPLFFSHILRSGFGSALKKTVCINNISKNCMDCFLGEDCVYQKLFQPSLPPGAPRLTSYSKIPQPFVVYTPKEGGLFQFGDTLQWYLLLIGKAVVSLPICVVAFSKMGWNGLGRDKIKFRILKVIDADENDEVFKGKGKIRFAPPIPFFYENNKKVKSIKIRIITPLRAKSQGKIARNFPFKYFIRLLLLRASMLASFHGEKEFPVNYKAIYKEAEKVITKEERLSYFQLNRFSMHDRKERDLSGMIGIIRYSGNLTPFMPLLKFGERFHIGKSTSFGLGKYIIEIEA